jgi:hypothetical protein
MGKLKLKNGTCHLCGEDSLLNFEHVPPRSTFNKKTRCVQASFLEYMQSDNPFEKEIKGKVNQGGIGYYAYCERCNNFLGNEYVRSYKPWAEIGGYILSKGKFNVYEYDIYKQKLNRIIKLILSMFVAMNDSWFGNEYPEIIEFIKNPSSTELSDRFKVFMYLNNGPQYRYLPFMVHGSLTDGKATKCCELAFPPYGYILTIDSEKEFDYLAEITHFKSFDSNEQVKQSMRIARLETNLPIPFDYRNRNEILMAIKESKCS